MRSWVFVIALPLLLGAQCLPSELEIPYEAETPAVTIDLAASVQDFEANINEAGGENQLVLRALCETESGRSCQPPTLPAQIPRSLPDPRPSHSGESLDVTAWLQDVPAFDALSNIAQAIALDVGAELDLSSPDAIKAVRIDSVTVRFSENTLTYPLPATNVYAGTDVALEELLDAKALIEANRVTHFGLLEQIPAASTEAYPMQLSDAGKTSFSEALMKLDVAMAFSCSVGFPPAGTAPIAKPDGKGVLSAKIKAVFVVATGAEQLL